MGFERLHIRLLQQGGAGAPWEVEVAFDKLLSPHGEVEVAFATELHFPQSRLSPSLKDLHYFSQKIEVNGVILSMLRVDTRSWPSSPSTRCHSVPEILVKMVERNFLRSLSTEPNA